MRPSLPFACVAALTLLLTSNVRADESELRLSVAAAASSATTKAFEGEGTNILVGGGANILYGLQDWLELGLNVEYLYAPDALLTGAVLSEQGGDDRHELYTTLRVYNVALALRSYLDFGPFLRLRPFLGGKIGVQATNFVDPELFFQDGSAISKAGSDWSTSLLLTGEIGIDYRLSDKFAAALLLNFSKSDVSTMLGLGFELSWLL